MEKVLLHVVTIVVTNTTIIYCNPLKFSLQYNNSLNCSYTRTVIDDNATLDILKIIFSTTAQDSDISPVGWGFRYLST